MDALNAESWNFWRWKLTYFRKNFSKNFFRKMQIWWKMGRFSHWLYHRKKIFTKIPKKKSKFWSSMPSIIDFSLHINPRNGFQSGIWTSKCFCALENHKNTVSVHVNSRAASYMHFWKKNFSYVKDPRSFSLQNHPLHFKNFESSALSPDSNENGWESNTMILSICAS